MAKLGDFQWPIDPPGSILFVQMMIAALEIAAETMSEEQLREAADAADVEVDAWVRNHADIPEAVHGIEAARSALAAILRR